MRDSLKTYAAPAYDLDKTLEKLEKIYLQVSKGFMNDAELQVSLLDLFK